MYEHKRPSRKVLQGVIDWLAVNQINLYTFNCDAEAGIIYGANMDIDTVDEILNIYKHNKADDWVEEHFD